MRRARSSPTGGTHHILRRVGCAEQRRGEDERDEEEGEIQPAPPALSNLGPSAEVWGQGPRRTTSARPSMREAAEEGGGRERTRARQIAQPPRHPFLARLSAQPHAGNPSDSRAGSAPVVRALEPAMSASAPEPHQGRSLQET